MIGHLYLLFPTRILVITLVGILLLGLLASDFVQAYECQSIPLDEAPAADRSSSSAGADGPHSLAQAPVTTDVAPLRLEGPSQGARKRAVETYGRLPLIFEDNRGQSDGQVKYLSRGNGFSLLLSSVEAVLLLQNSKPLPHLRNDALNGVGGQDADGGYASSRKVAPAPLRIQFPGATKDPKITGVSPLPGRSNYFHGKDPEKWSTDILQYARVKYHDLYPGIDLVFYGNQRQLEYDFVVHPGADPGAIRLKFGGVDHLDVDEEGNLVLRTSGGQVTQRKPVAYQMVDGSKQSLDGSYEIKGRDEVGFKVAAYDKTEVLIIDPVLVYSTYLGGTYPYYYGYGWDFGTAIAVDKVGNAYVVGETYSTTFPTVTPLQGYNANGYDIFISKLSADGTTLLYSTYLGGANEDISFNGNNEDNASAVALDSAGNIYIAGLTNSTDFPTTDNAYRKTNAGGYDAMVTVLNAAGNALLYSSYLGGSGTDYGMGLVVDSSGNAYITGITTSTDFPVKNAVQATYGGGPMDAFVAKVNPSASGEESLVFSTYLGGNGDDRGYRIAIDTLRNVYITGATSSTNFPAEDAFQDTFGGGNFDAFVTKINGTTGEIVYSTYLGGSGEDRGVGIAVDTSGNAYVAGRTASSNFPTTAGAFSTSCGTDGLCNNDGVAPTKFDAFLAKLNASGEELVYSTYLGGSGNDQGIDVAVDSANHAYVVGITGSTDFPLVNPLQDTKKGDVDAFVAKLNANGSSLMYSTYLGGSATDQGYGIPEESVQSESVTVDDAGSVYLTGYTWSTDFPVTAGAYQTANAEAYDAFILKIASPLYFDFAAPSGHGTILCTIPSDPHGSSTCTLTPDTGYYLRRLIDNALDVTSLVSNGTYTIPDVTEHTITATFQIYPVRRISGTVTSYYLRLQDAFDTAASGDTILSLSLTFNEMLNLRHGVLIALTGGQGSDFTSQTSFTTIQGSMTIGAGTAIVENVILR